MPYRDEARCHRAPHSVTPFVGVSWLTSVPLLRTASSQRRSIKRYSRLRRTRSVLSLR